MKYNLSVSIKRLNRLSKMFPGTELEEALSLPNGRVKDILISGRITEGEANRVNNLFIERRKK